ncbi:MAG: hypothetical protein Q9176_003970 [Flavoplaca citrina]
MRPSLTTTTLLLLPLAINAQVSQIADGQIQAPADTNPNAQGPPVSIMTPTPIPLPSPISPTPIPLPSPISPTPIPLPSPISPPAAPIETPIEAPSASSAAPVEVPSAPIASPEAPIASPAAPVEVPSAPIASPAPVYPVNNGTNAAGPSGFATGTASASVPAETSSSTEAPITPAVPGSAAMIKMQVGVWGFVAAAVGLVMV